GTVFGRFTDTNYTNIQVNGANEITDVFFVQKTRNWQVSHSWPVGTNLVNQFRFGYIGATANQHGSTGDPADVAALKLTGVFAGLDDDQRSLPGIAWGGVGTGLIRGGSAVNDYQASYQPMWDVSNNTAKIRGRHTLNFGANYRRWSLQRDLANDFLGDISFSGFSPATRPVTMRSLTCCSVTSTGPLCFSRVVSLSGTGRAIRASSTT